MFTKDSLITAICAATLFGFAVGAFVESGRQRGLDRQEAIKAGVAKWSVDETGEMKFEYLPRK